MKKVICGAMSVVLMLLSAFCWAEERKDTGDFLLQISDDPGYEASAEHYLSPTHYLDDTLEVNITTDRHLDSDVWIAEVKITDASQLRSAFSYNYESGETATVATIAKRMNAVLALNGDYCTYDYGVGVVVRNGRRFRTRPNGTLDLLVIDTNGDLTCMLTPDRREYDLLYEEKGGVATEGGEILHVLSFGPALIVDGELAHTNFVRPDNSHNKPTQRTVIAQKGPLHYLILSCSGPESVDSRGMTLNELAEYMLSLDVTTAYNLDGGSSSTLVFNGEKVNSLDTGKVRLVPDILYFSTGIKPQ